jgi:HK97 family phage portal protein
MLGGFISRARDYFASHARSIGGWLTYLWSTEDSGRIDTAALRSIPALSRAVALVAETIAALDLSEYHKDKDGNYTKEKKRKTAKTLTESPNNYQSAYTFWEAYLMNLIFEGNAIALMEMSEADGEVTSLELISFWDEVQEMYVKNGNLYYKINGFSSDVPASRVLHVAGPSMDGIRGDSLADRFRETWETDRAVLKYLKNFFKNGANIRGVIEVDRVLGDAGKKSLSDSFAKYHHRGPDSPNATPVLEGGAKYRPTGANIMDAGVREISTILVEQVARIIGVPLHLLQNMQGTSYNTIEHLAIEFQKNTIAPFTKRIESELNRKLGRPNREWRFDLSGLLYGDMETQGDYLQKLFNMSILNPDEIRQRIGLGKVPHGQNYYIQGNNMIPVDLIEKYIAEKFTGGQQDPGVDLPTLSEKDVNPKNKGAEDSDDDDNDANDE